ncbi:MAG: YgdI/YgdR family lipoprotein [Pedosphaera sp.]|nr:YgdI/YgdR family lipoprotein [Pedosphaera sp.]
MKTFLPIVLLAAALLTGCASRYTITLNNGNRITATSKPKLQNGNYVFKDMKGQVGYIPAGRVREVSPANMSSSRMSSGYSAEPVK